MGVRDCAEFDWNFAHPDFRSSTSRSAMGRVCTPTCYSQPRRARHLRSVSCDLLDFTCLQEDYEVMGRSGLDFLIDREYALSSNKIKECLHPGQSWSVRNPGTSGSQKFTKKTPQWQQLPAIKSMQLIASFVFSLASQLLLKKHDDDVERV